MQHVACIIFLMQTAWSAHKYIEFEVATLGSVSLGPSELIALSVGGAALTLWTGWNIVSKLITWVKSKTPSGKFKLLWLDINNHRVETYRRTNLGLSNSSNLFKNRQSLTIKLTALKIDFPDFQNNNAWNTFLIHLAAFSENGKIAAARNLKTDLERQRYI